MQQINDHVVLRHDFEQQCMRLVAGPMSRSQAFTHVHELIMTSGLVAYVEDLRAVVLPTDGDIVRSTTSLREGVAPALPRTKNEALALLRPQLHSNATVYVEQVHSFGQRDRLLSFALESGVSIDHLVTRLLELPLEQVPGQPGRWACRARDTGDGVGQVFVSQLGHRLYRSVFSLKSQVIRPAAPDAQQEKEC